MTITVGIGERIARALFKRRGDNSETHLQEHQLAYIIQQAYELGFRTGHTKGIEEEQSKHETHQR